MIKNNKLRFEQSSLALVVSNIVTIVIAVWQKWSFADVMLTYWGQSLIIGYFNLKRILYLKQFSTEGLTILGKHVEPTRSTKMQVAAIFALQYTILHIIYLHIFSLIWDMSHFDLRDIIVCIAIFFFNHRFSFYQNLDSDLHRKPNIGHIMLFPHARILPFHFIILFGSLFAKNSVGTLLLFLSLKTLADLIMHLIEHSRSFKPDEPVSSESSSEISKAIT